MRRIAGLDTLGASKLLRGLRDRGLLALQGAGSSTDYELGERLAHDADGGRLPPNHDEWGESGPRWGGARAPMGELAVALTSEQDAPVQALGARFRRSETDPGRRPEPSHPAQAYRTKMGPLFSREPREADE